MPKNSVGNEPCQHEERPTAMKHECSAMAKRRGFLAYAAAGLGATAFTGGLWLAGGVVSLARGKEHTQAVDLRKLRVGEQQVHTLQSKPVFVRRLSEQDMRDAAAIDLINLRDAGANNANLSVDAVADVGGRTVGPDSAVVVFWGVCTHLGCMPLVGEGDFGGWFCPCQGSHYDVLGRVRSGPAPRNLAIPHYSVSQSGLLTFSENQNGPDGLGVDELIFGKPDRG